MPERIITHPGGAHKDDLLATALLLAKYPVPVDRRDPTEAELADAAVAVVDIGGRHDPERLNFDHHQFPREHEPTCALSLVLQAFGLYADARRFCEWLEMTEWLDCRGPGETAARFGFDPGLLGQLNSPVDVTTLRRFAAADRHEPGQPVWEWLRRIGSDLLEYLEHLRGRLDAIGRQAVTWSLGGNEAEPLVLFMPRIEPLPEEPSAGIGHYLREVGLEGAVVATIYPDRRGAGYGLRRMGDDPRVDFKRIEGQPDVHFAHKQGFIAKTSATDPARLLHLVQCAFSSA